MALIVADTWGMVILPDEAVLALIVAVVINFTIGYKTPTRAKEIAGDDGNVTRIRG